MITEFNQDTAVACNMYGLYFCYIYWYDAGNWSIPKAFVSSSQDEWNVENWRKKIKQKSWPQNLRDEVKAQESYNQMAYIGQVWEISHE